VLDLDDATWVRYESPTHGLLAGLLRPPGKTFRLIDRATCVTCGSPYVAAEVAARGGTAVLLPPAVDTTTYRPAADRPAADLPVVGWIGTHSTYPCLEAVLPALRAVARTHPIRLRVVGSGRPAPDLPGIDLDWRDWSLEREPDDFASLDVGLYPLPAGDAWAAGKAGLKSVQYLACGVPFVASPVGGAKTIGVPGSTHLTAATPDEWQASLEKLIADPGLRARMGADGRRHAVAHHTAGAAAATLAEVLWAVAA